MSYTSNSKSNRRKPKFFPKPKQQWQVKQHKPNWLDLPYDVMANILCRVSVYDTLQNAQKACTTWRKICNDPTMWRVIYMGYTLSYPPHARSPSPEMFKYALDRSQGQLVDLTIEYFVNHKLLEYVADRSSQLRRLHISYGNDELYGRYEFLKKFPLLEELSLYRTRISIGDIEIVGRCCPMLRSLKVNQVFYGFGGYDRDVDDGKEYVRIQNEIAIAIGKNLPELRHLELIGNRMTNDGLQVILDGCRHLESLDLCNCLYIDLKGNLGKICLEKIKCLTLK